jgi:hypothetical protein
VIGPVTPPPPGAGGADTTAPRLSAVSLSHRRFRVAAAHAAASASKVPAGTAFRFTLSEPASVRIGFERGANGRRSGKSCVRATRANRSAKPCTRWVRTGVELRSDDLAAGARNVTFSGRIGRHALAVGRYRATLTATDPAGNRSTPYRLGFQVIP